MRASVAVVRDLVARLVAADDAAEREVLEELGVTAGDDLSAAPIFLTVTDTVGTGARHTDVSLWWFLHKLGAYGQRSATP